MPLLKAEKKLLPEEIRVHIEPQIQKNPFWKSQEVISTI